MFKELVSDAVWYHRIRFPDSEPSVLSVGMALFRSRGLLSLAAHRTAHGVFERRSAGLRGRPCAIAAGHVLRWFSRLISKSSVLWSTRLEAPVVLSDLGHIIIGAESIGSGTVIHDRVTLGRNLSDNGTPTIGRNVWIGHDCVITGAITVGDGVTILPWTVLTKSLPSNVVVAGNPARIILRGFDNSGIRNGTLRDPSLPFSS